MGGLLDFLGTPAGQGLLGAAFSGMAGARRGAPINTLGAAGVGGLLAYNQAQRGELDRAREDTANKLAALQLKQAQQQADDQQAVRDLAPQFVRTPAQISLARGASMGDQPSGMGQDGSFYPIAKNIGPTPGNLPANPSGPAQFDQSGFINALMAKNPMLAMQMRAQMGKEVPIDKLKAENFTPESLARFSQSGNYGDLVARDKLEEKNGVWANPYTGKTVTVGAQDPNKPFMFDANGQIVPNTGYQTFEVNKARAGKTDVNLAVNTEKSLLNTMGEGLGKQLDASLAGARSAANTVNTAQQIRGLVESGKVITGPGADYRVTLARIGDAMGVGGKDNAEKLANTSQLVQNLAKSELDASQIMRGQGAITESERVLIRRAASGDLNMSSGELVTLSNAIEKNARARIKQHQSQVQRLQGMPGAAPLIPFYSVDEPPLSGDALHSRADEIIKGAMNGNR